MDATTCNNLITKYFNTLFSKGYRMFVPTNPYIYSNHDVFTSIVEDVDAVIANAKKYNSNINSFNDIIEKFNRYSKTFLNDGLYIMPNFKPLIENKLRSIIDANPDIQIVCEESKSNDEYIGAQLNQIKQINIDITRAWYDLMRCKNIDGMFYNKADIINAVTKCENLSDMIEDKFFANYVMTKPVFTLIDCANRGYLNESVIEDFINVIASEEFTQKLDRYANDFVDQYIGTTTFYKKVCDYINNMENACFLNEKGMKPVERNITINFNSSSNDNRIRYWENKGRSGQDNFEIFQGYGAYALVEYRLANAIHGVRRKRTNENVSNYIKMNRKNESKECYVDATMIRFTNKGQIGRTHFVFANRKPLNMSNGYKYVNDFYNPCEYMVLQVPLMWSAIGMEPTSVANFLPDMGADMDMNFNF